MLLGALLAVAAASDGAGAAPAASAERPNVVLILSDDQHVDSLSAMPFVSAREDWVEFTSAIANTALCCPSRASFLTGQTSHHTGVISNGMGPKLEGVPTVADWLQGSAYETAFFGKYLNKFPWDLGEAHIPSGWDHWNAFTGNQSYVGYSANENGSISRHDDPERDYATDYFARAAAEYVETQEGPFFALVSLFGPHGPFRPAPRHAGVEVPEPVPGPAFAEADVSDKPSWVRELSPLDRERALEVRRQHDRALLAVDDAVREIFDALRRGGKLDETVVVYSTDHGIAFGEHNLRGKNCAYEACSRIPFLVRAPGVEGGTVETPVGNIDFAPTLMDWAGIEPGAPVDGRSFRPLLERDPDARRARALLLRRGAGPRPLRYWGLRTKRFKYVRYPATGERELYELRRDPDELKNLYAGERRKWRRVGRTLQRRVVALRAKPPR